MPGESVFIGLGSNRGNRTAHLRRALAALAAAGAPASRVSSLYLSAPVLAGASRRLPAAATASVESPGLADASAAVHPWYLNCVARLDGAPPPAELLHLCQTLEVRAGRPATREPAPQPRTLDLDLLLYGARVIEGPRLEIPHPRMHRRRFVLQPLCDIAPDARHPTEAATARQLLERLPDDGDVWLLAADWQRAVRPGSRPCGAAGAGAAAGAD